MRAFGISNHSPDQTISFLQKRRVITDGSEVAILTFGSRLKADKPLKRKVIFIVSITDFFNNAKVISESASEALVFLFASPLRVNEIKGMTPLDFEPNEEYQGMAYRLTAIDPERFRVALKNPAPERIYRDTTNYLTQLIETVKQGSLLNPLMTFIYMLPRASHQTPVKESVAQGFYHGWSSDKVFESIAGKDLQLSNKAANVLEGILTSDIALAYAEAFKLYRVAKKSGTVNLKSICKKCSTSDYEMRYLVSVVEGRLTKVKSRGKSIANLDIKEPKSKIVSWKG